MPNPPRLFITFAMIGFGSALVYLGALLRFPLLAIYDVPLQNLDKLTNSAPGTGLVIAGCVLLLFVGYGLGALALARGREVRGVTGAMLLGFPLIFAVILLFVYPTTSLDVYDYLFRGRMAVRYAANNFVQVPADFQNDPLIAAKPFRFIPWHHAVTAYGPLWEAVSAATAWLSGERFGSAPTGIDPELRNLLIGYKLLGMLGFLVCSVAIWLALRVTAPPQRWLGLYVWLWNPLVLWESVAAAHNDAWMMATIVLALALMSRRTEQPVTGSFIRPLASFLALTIGALFKYLALIFGPLLLAASLRRLTTWRERITLIGVSALVCGGLVMLAYAPFWQGMATLRNFGDRGTLFYATWMAAAQAGAQELGVTKELAQRAMSALATALLAGGVMFSAWRAWQEPDDVAAHALGLLLWFLLVANPWFQPWYLLWPLALVAIQPGRRPVVGAVMLFSLTAMLSYLAGSFLLPLLGWKGDSAVWNALLSVFIYGPPLLVLFSHRKAVVATGFRVQPQMNADERR